MIQSKRCSMCAINYPYLLNVGSCPICDEELTQSYDPITMDWQERVKEHVAVRRLETDDELFPAIRGILRREGKQYLLSTHDVVNAGINRRLADGEIVRVVDDEGETYVEVLGYAYQGRVYLVRLFTITWPTDKKGRAFVPKRWKRK